MANRSKGGRRRSRKRRSASAGAATVVRSAVGEAAAPEAAATTPSATSAPAKRERRARRREAAAKPDGGYRAPGSVGERPRAPWHPVPLAELLILVGMVAVAIGVARGESGKAILFVGIGAVLIGTLDTTIREHLSGYRSHAALLASIPTALFHGGAALALYALGTPSVTWVIVPLAIDVPLFYVLHKLLRARFQDARRERVFAGKR
jgi:hypothetical protein